MTSPGEALAPLLRRTAWRFARQHPWQTWLSFLGVALGVMMVVAVDLATSSAERAFALSVGTISGNTTHRISGGSAGVPDSVFAGLRRELGLRRSAPSVSGSVRVGRETFTLLGLDPFSELSLGRQRPGLGAEAQGLGQAIAALASRQAVLLAAPTAARLGLAVGDRLPVTAPTGQFTLDVVALLDPGDGSGLDQVLLADIATAQELLGRLGVLDSIDLVLDESEVRRVNDWLPPALVLVPQRDRYDALSQMTRAFSTNLLAMSLLALLVATLLIYNTVNLSVLQRQQAFGVLRGLGVGRHELLRLVLYEVLWLGLAASTAGVLLGLGLGQFLVKLVTRTIDDLYFNLTVTRFLLEPAALLKGWGCGVLLTLLAGALPAWRAAQVPPITLQQEGQAPLLAPQQTLRFALYGVLTLALGQALLWPAERSLLLGFVALTCMVGGACLLVPACVQAVLRLLLQLPVGWLRQTQRLAIAMLQAGGSRVALAVAALAVAVSVTVGVGVMVASFRGTVLLWLEQSLQGDLLVTALQAGTPLPATLTERVAAMPGVRRQDRQWRLRSESSVGSVVVQASEGDGGLFLKELAPEGLADVSGGEALLVSEPLAWQAGLQLGDRVTLQAATGPLTLPVAGVFYDYSTEGGIVALDPLLLQRAWPATAPARLVIHLAAAVEPETVARTLRAELEAAGQFGVAANADIRRITLEIFDRTFAITHVLRLLAIGVAFVGILSALLTLQLQRLRDYALLRASGMTVQETAGMILFQTTVMGLLAGLLALPLGLLMADVLIDVINRRSFGWTMQQLLPTGVLWQALLLSLVAALLAAWLPVRRVAAVRPAIGLRAP